MKKKIFAILFATLMLIAMSVSVLAADGEGEVPSEVGTKGSNVSVNINLTNNPGIAGAKLTVEFDAEVFEFVEVKDVANSGMKIVSSTNTDDKITLIVLSVDSEGNYDGHEVTGNITVATVVLKVKQDAQLGESAITVTFDEAADADMADKAILMSEGTVEIKDYMLGDLNGDNRVNDKDAIHLLYYTFNPSGYPINQDCDFNNDGRVNDKDAIYLLYYTFNPNGYPLS